MHCHAQGIQYGEVQLQLIEGLTHKKEGTKEKRRKKTVKYKETDESAI
jgi:hypothetical protein